MQGTGVPRQAALAEPKGRRRGALALRAGDVSPSGSVDELGRIGDLGSPANTTTYGDVVQDDPGDQLRRSGGCELSSKLVVSLLQSLLDGLAFGQKSVPIGDTFDDHLDSGEPEGACFESPGGGDLHAASQVDEELNNACRFGVTDDWHTGDGGHTAAVADGLQPPWPSGLWAKVLGNNWRLKV